MVGSGFGLREITRVYGGWNTSSRQTEPEERRGEESETGMMMFLRERKAEMTATKEQAAQLWWKERERARERMDRDGVM